MALTPSVDLVLSELLKMQMDSTKLSVILETFEEGFEHETEPRYSYRLHEVIGTLESLNTDIIELLKSITDEFKDDV